MDSCPRWRWRAGRLTPAWSDHAALVWRRSWTGAFAGAHLEGFELPSSGLGVLDAFDLVAGEGCAGGVPDVAVERGGLDVVAGGVEEDEFFGAAAGGDGGDCGHDVRGSGDGSSGPARLRDAEFVLGAAVGGLPCLADVDRGVGEVDVPDLQGREFAEAHACAGEGHDERLVEGLDAGDEALELVGGEVDVVDLGRAGQACAFARVGDHLPGAGGLVQGVGEQGVAVADGLAGVAAGLVHPDNPSGDLVLVEHVERRVHEVGTDVELDVATVGGAGAGGDAGEAVDVVHDPGDVSVVCFGASSSR